MQRRSDGSVEGFLPENVCAPSPVLERQDSDAKIIESAENFQKSMYELFEKNGVMNDLRAYLRGHIVEIIQSSRTGDIPACQKNFTQRLELPIQAINMLLAEYLLRYEYSYTLSVFVSEIPLANMVLAFAKSLIQDADSTALRFTDEDIWSIFNYLGIKCDSEHASNVVKMYRDEKDSSLLLCMFKCMTMYKEPVTLENDLSSESLSSSVSLSSLSVRSPSNHVTLVHEKCKHSAYCRVCKAKMMRIKDRYKKKKRNLTQNFKYTNTKPQKMDSLIKNIDTMERSFIDEIFQQLKTVYETEIEMAKSNEEIRVKRVLAKHAVQLQQKRSELEDAFKSREDALQASIQHKKRFLWGLARLLREQHAQLAHAMADVRDETSRLTAKKDSLKSQMANAERALQQKAEDMRHQISSELAILEKHLLAMREERDVINRERSELDQIRSQYESRTVATEKENTHPHYDLLKNELAIVQKYLDSVKTTPKCIIERGTMTDLADVSSKIDVILNNGQDIERSSSENIVKATVVNNFKKPKNINLQSNVEDDRWQEVNLERSRSTLASERDRDSLRRLSEENERLRNFARQQRDHIDELSSGAAQLRAELAARAPPAVVLRPRTAPASAHGDLQNVTAPSPNTLSPPWRAGAGEELSRFTSAHPRVILPGDTLPFIGVLRDRHNDNRRYLISQWRALRRRISPTTLAKPRARVPKEYNRTSTAGPSVRVTPDQDSEENLSNNEDTHQPELHSQPARERQSELSEDLVKIRDKSPKSVLREAKERLKPKEPKPLPSPRGQSPATVLREAKLRLRKLEIEAEAVEKSYMDFRKKQKERGERMEGDGGRIERDNMDKYDLKKYRPTVSFDVKENKDAPSPRLKTPDYNKYIEEFRTKYNLSETHFYNKNSTAAKVKPIPSSYTTNETSSYKCNYLETPIVEFRKFYHSEKYISNSSEERRKSDVTENSEFKKRDNSPTYIDIDLFHNRPKSPSTMLQKNFEKESVSKSSTSLNADNTISVKISPKSIVSRNRDMSEDFDDFSTEMPEKLNIRSRSNSPVRRNVDSKNDNDNTNETFKEMEQEKAKELEILKQNISKMYNLCEKSITNSPVRRNVNTKNDNDGDTNVTFKQTEQEEAKELEILKQNISKMYNFCEKSITKNNSGLKEAVENVKRKLETQRNSAVHEMINEASRYETTDDFDDYLDTDKNSLQIEIQSVSQINDVKLTESQTQDLLLFVESSNNKSNLELDFEKGDLPAPMTLIISPKKIKLTDENNAKASLKSPKKLFFGENSEQKNYSDSINKADTNKNMSDEMQLNLNKEHWMRKSGSVTEDPDYPDDFSEDVDNINSQRYDTDSDNRSPISLPKNSEKDDFWDS